MYTFLHFLSRGNGQLFPFPYEISQKDSFHTFVNSAFTVTKEFSRLMMLTVIKGNRGMLENWN